MRPSKLVVSESAATRLRARTRSSTRSAASWLGLQHPDALMPVGRGLRPEAFEHTVDGHPPNASLVRSARQLAILSRAENGGRPTLSVVGIPVREPLKHEWPYVAELLH